MEKSANHAGVVVESEWTAWVPKFSTTGTGGGKIMSAQNTTVELHQESLDDLLELLLQGLISQDPGTRRQSAEGLGRRGCAKQLPALREASKRETDLNCKVAIVKAINLIEEGSIAVAKEAPEVCTV
jgi:hypothetical protein